MATLEKNLICEIVVEKMMKGESLEEAEKSHLAECETGMTQIIRVLDESAGVRNGDLDHVRPKAIQVLEHGRFVFEREFGISLTKE